jgi:hypothetical protein
MLVDGIAGAAALQQFKLDTGAVMSFFPFSVWPDFEKAIEWMNFETPDGHVMEYVVCKGVGGGRVPCRIGRVRVRFVGAGVKTRCRYLIGYFEKQANALCSPQPVEARIGQGVDDNAGTVLLGLGGHEHGTFRLIVNHDSERPLAFLELM